MPSCHSQAALGLALVLNMVVLAPGMAAGQDATPPESRAAALEQAQGKKAQALHPYEPGKVEHIFNKIEEGFVRGGPRVHPFIDNAYAGGGFTLGAGYLRPVSAYNSIDVRGSITFKGYKLIEAAFAAPRLFHRRAALMVIGGWREATQVGFYGIGTTNTSKDDRANYSFDQPYGSAMIDFRPARKLLLLRGGLELSRWNQGAGGGSAPSVDEVYTPETLAGLGSTPTYVHSQATLALDSRPAAGYARRGGFYGVTFNDFHDPDGEFGFRRIDYEAIQHVPILREAWVLSLHARVQLADAAGGETIPFFMLPALGGGSSLRGFSSWRFRDLNSLLLQADWRVIANRFLDVALVYDAGSVAARAGDLTDGPLKSDYGIGFRFHGFATTPLRIEFVRSNEGFKIVFASKAAF